MAEPSEDEVEAIARHIEVAHATAATVRPLTDDDWVIGLPIVRQNGTGNIYKLNRIKAALLTARAILSSPTIAAKDKRIAELEAGLRAAEQHFKAIERKCGRQDDDTADDDAFIAALQDCEVIAVMGQERVRALLSTKSEASAMYDALLKPRRARGTA